MIINSLSPTSKSQCFSLALTGVDSRIGLDSPVFGDFWQNGPHGPIGTPQFDPNYGRNTKLYLYNQFYKPYTPW